MVRPREKPVRVVRLGGVNRPGVKDHPVDIRQLIDTTRMSAYQWLIVLIAAFISALDGYDIVAMAFSATAVSTEFGLGAIRLGWLLSSALIGVGLGSLLLAPLADRFGRKRLLLASLLVNAVCLVLTALAQTFAELFLWRILTGVAVGGVITSVSVLTSEFANAQYRGLSMSIFSAGYGLGATLCGALAAALIPEHGWRMVFWVSTALTALGFALVAVIVPESPDSVAAHGRQEQAQHLARRLGKGDAVVAVADRTRADKSRFGDVLAPEYRRTTLLLWLTFALATFIFYFASQWTPRLLTAEGLTERQGVIGGIMLTVGNTLGALLYGVSTIRFPARRLLIWSALAASAALVLLIPSMQLPVLMLVCGVSAGMLLSGCITGMYTIVPAAYPSYLRATGTGITLGVGRIGAILGPVVVGYLVHSGWSSAALYTGAAVIAVCVALSTWAIEPSKT